MKTFALKLFILFCFPGPVWGQVFHDSLFGHPTRIIPNDAGYNQLEVDNEGNIFLLNSSKAEVTKYFYAWNYDSLQTVGGRSNRQDGFLHPIKIEVTNRQRCWVLDDVQRRLVLLNNTMRLSEEVNFLSFNPVLDGTGTEEMMPSSFSVNGAGEFFLLNQLDLRIYKVNVQGNLEMTFGGLDYGEGALLDPVDIRSSDENLLFVSDTLSGELKVFDNFGIYRYRLQPEVPFRWNGFHLYEDYIFLYDQRRIYVEHLPTRKKRTYTVFDEGKLLDLGRSRNQFFLLTSEAIYLYLLDR